MNIALWIVQIVLAVVFILHGLQMISPPASLAERPAMSYIFAISPGWRRLLGVLEILAGVGLVLPWLLNILPWLTPLAALGLVLVMIGAIVMHIPRREYPNIVFNLVLLILAAFVAYGRFVLVA
jgi:uncharacterized membrane protein YphA (DoxX/SURF4 family)